MPHISLNSAEPGIRGLLRYRPETGRPLSELAEVLLRGPGTLTRGERELIAAYVSGLNDCQYCSASHSACAAAQLPEGMALVDQVRADASGAPVSGKLKALLAIAAAVQRGGLQVTDEHIARARAAGATDLEIHDTVLIAAAFCMMNRYVERAGHHRPGGPRPVRGRRAAPHQGGLPAAARRLSSLDVDRHEVVLLHGQPGSAADWQQLAGRLPGPLDVVALDRPGYGTSQQPAGGFGYGARAVLAELDARGIGRAVLVGHSYGGGVALSVAQLAPGRVEALVLLASVGPACLTGWDRLLAAPVTGEVCALTAWWLTPWVARARLAAITRRRGRPLTADEHVNWHIWGHAHHDHGPLWRSFLTEQRALVQELGSLTASLADVTQPVLLIADPDDTLIPVSTTHQLAAALPDARVQLLSGIGHHLPRRGAAQTAAAITGFLTSLDSRPAPA